MARVPAGLNKHNTIKTQHNAEEEKTGKITEENFLSLLIKE